MRIVLLILIGGVIFVQSTRVGLIDERLTGIKEQALIVAGTLAEYTTDDATRSIKVRRGRAAAAPADRADALRARLYGTDGALEVDTRNLLARNIVQTYTLAAARFLEPGRAGGRRASTTASWACAPSPSSSPISKPARTGASIPKSSRR